MGFGGRGRGGGGALASTVPSHDPLLYVLVKTASKYFCGKLFCNILQISVVFAIALLSTINYSLASR